MEEKYNGQGFSFTLNDKHYFALYLNLAQNNLAKILNEFEKQYPKLHNNYLPNLPGVTTNKLHLLLPLKEDDEVQTRERLNYLKRTLPFVNSILKKGEYDVYREELIHLFTRLNHLRNFFTHDYYEKEELSSVANEQLITFLSKVKMEVLYKLNKEPYAVRDEHLNHLSDLQGHWNFNKPENLQAAISFMICLFLDRKTAHEFLKCQRGYKSSSNMAHKATLMCYTLFSVKMPKPVLKSDDFNLRFVLEGINELKKCPKELFHHLSDQNKAFCQTIAEVEEEDDLSGEVKTEEKVVNVIRYEDRFPYFALRFLDEMNFLPKIRFQVCIGHRKEKFHTHANATEPVVHHKRVYTFARLCDLLNENAYTEKVLNEEGIEEHHLIPESGLENFAPTYALDGQNIKFVVARDKFDKLPDLKKENPEAVLADGILSIYELKNLVYACLQGESKSVQSLLIQQVYNYRKFLTDLQVGKFPPINYMGEKEVRKQQLNAYLTEMYNMKNTHIPKQILRSVLQIKQASYLERAINKCELWHNENEEQLYRVKDFINKVDEEAGAGIKQGSLAAELVKDIQFFMPEKYKMELFEYTELQRKMAFYQEIEVEKLIRREFQLAYYEKADKENQKSDLYFLKKHPFLHKVFQVESFNPRARFPKPKIIKNNTSSLFHFAYNYYKQKRKWLERVKGFMSSKTDESLKKEQALLYYFKLGTSEENGQRVYHRSYGSKQLKPLIQIINEHQIPVNMPRGLFNEILAGEEKLNAANASRQIETEYPATQAFYQFHRCHPNLGTDVDLETIQSDYHLLHHRKYRTEALEKQHKIFYYFLKREQKIRYFQNCDRLLWIMVQQHMAKHSKDMTLDFTGFELSDLFTGHLGAEEQRKGIGEKKLEVVYHIGDKPFRINEKLKNFGRMARYRYDARFVSLFRYKGESFFAHRPEDEMHAKIAGAIQEFTREQLELFKAVHHFEKRICETCADQLEQWRNEIRESNQQKQPNEQTSLHYFNHRFLVEKALQLQWVESENQKEFMIQARNSAAHNALTHTYAQLLSTTSSQSYFDEAIHCFHQTVKNHDCIAN